MTGEQCSDSCGLPPDYAVMADDLLVERPGDASMAAVPTCVQCGAATTNGEPGIENVIFDPVLAYCQLFMHSTSIDDVCRAIQVHFSNESLQIAREKLASSCKKWLDGTEIISVQFRRGSTARPAIEMNASDVANGVYKVMTSSDAPRFATLNLSMLPIVRPTEGNDRETDKRLHILEKRLSFLERRQEDDMETLSENTAEILRNTENAKRLKSVVNSILESPVLRNPRMSSDDSDNTYSAVTF